MLSFAFGYYIGQNVAWLLSSWVVSLLVCAVLPAVAFIIDSSTAARTFTVFVGWASVAAVPEYVLKTGHATFDGDVKNQLLPMLAVFDALVFIFISAATNVNDASPVIWLFLLWVHALYVWGIRHINHYVRRVHDDRGYFYTYMLVLICNDLFFFIVSLIVHGHPLNFISVLIAGALTGVPLLLASRNEVVLAWLTSRGGEE